MLNYETQLHYQSWTSENFYNAYIWQLWEAVGGKWKTLQNWILWQLGKLPVNSMKLFITFSVFYIKAEFGPLSKAIKVIEFFKVTWNFTYLQKFSFMLDLF